MSRGALPPDADPSASSPVFRQVDRLAPRVRQPDSPWSLALGLAFAVVLGVVVFGTLSAGRQARAAGQTPVDAQAAATATSGAPQARDRPDPAPPPASLSIAPTPSPVAQPVSAPDLETARRLRAPVMIVDLGANGPAAPAAAAVRPAGAAPSKAPEPPFDSAEDRFAARVASGDAETTRATRLRDVTRIVPQGTAIPAVLETAINSDLPGSVRAVVSRDVRGFDGSQVLIPRGSELIGQYRSGVAYGQHRAFVIWSRLLTPGGVSAEIGSPGADPLGRGGLSGETDSHFFQRFGGSILLSVLSAGVAAASPGGASTAVIIGSPAQAQTFALQAPQKTDMPVTIKVMPGTPMSVFLTRDLDFSNVTPAAQ